MSDNVASLTRYRMTHPHSTGPDAGPRVGRIRFEGGPDDGVILESNLPANATPGFRVQGFAGPAGVGWYTLTDREEMTAAGPTIIAAHIEREDFPRSA